MNLRTCKLRNLLDCKTALTANSDNIRIARASDQCALYKPHCATGNISENAALWETLEKPRAHFTFNTAYEKEFLPILLFLTAP